MAFIGLLAVMVTAVVMIFLIGVAPILLGTVLYRNTTHKRLGLALRVIGYILLIPSLILGTALALLVWQQF